MTEFSKLIPELLDWNNGAGIDATSWIGCVGDYEKAIGYSTIFWPEFVEIDGHVLRAQASLHSLKNGRSGNRKEVEAVVNHLHLRDIQHLDCPGATPERLSYLGKTLKEIYECKLKRDFPGRSFVVEFTEGNTEDLDGFILTFYQK